ncbi:MAG: ATPase [Actinobacteria bacterium]|nr:MAG: ATPase [Actinomycetota bacterium]
MVLAVDGGNFKTDLALVRADGSALALVRGPQSSPHHLGVDGCVRVLEELLATAVGVADLPNGRGPVADVAQLLLAGVDFPSEEEEVQAAVNDRRLAKRVSVGNDTYAVLRAGTERGWGVAIVCGSGINCLGVAPDGRQTRFPALGEITGDWGGGHDVGLAGVSAAARSEDGRGPRTSLEQAVPAHFGLDTPTELAEAIHRGRIAMSRVTEVAPVVVAESGSDAVAGAIMDRLADEIAALVRVALVRLSLTNEPAQVLLGGGLIDAADGALVDAVARRTVEIAPAATVTSTSSPPIVGAALLGLDELGSDEAARERLRSELGARFARIGREAGS